MVGVDLDQTDVYNPFDSHDEIHVLVVHAGHVDEPIETTLEYIPLISPVRIRDHVVCVGDSQERCSIFVSGKTLDVLASAERAIRRMRTSTDHTPWIDAICTYLYRS